MCVRERECKSEGVCVCKSEGVCVCVSVSVCHLGHV